MWTPFSAMFSPRRVRRVPVVRKPAQKRQADQQLSDPTKALWVGTVMDAEFMGMTSAQQDRFMERTHVESMEFYGRSS